MRGTVCVSSSFCVSILFEGAIISGGKQTFPAPSLCFLTSNMGNTDLVAWYSRKRSGCGEEEVIV